MCACYGHLFTAESQAMIWWFTEKLTANREQNDHTLLESGDTMCGLTKTLESCINNITKIGSLTYLIYYCMLTKRQILTSRFYDKKVMISKMISKIFIKQSIVSLFKMK